MAKLTSAEIRKLIKAHNIEATVKIPTGLKQDELEKFVESKGFKINHDEKSISKGGKKITLEQAEKVTAPKAKTALQKQKAAEKKEEKVVVQKKKERELKKEAVKKATKDMVPKTKPPQKIGAKPVPEKKEKKKFPTEGAKKVGEAIKKRKEEAAKKKAQAKAPAPTPKTTVSKKPRRQLKETKKPTGSDVVQPGMPKDVKIEEKESPIKEKIETPDEKFLRFLNTVGFALGRSQTGEKGALEFTNNRKVNRVMKVLEPIVENKKTSKFTKKEKEGIKDALNYYIKSISPERKEDHKVFTQMVKNIEDYNSVTGKAKEEPKKGEAIKEKKIRKGTVREKKSFATLKDSWSTGAKLTFKWSPEQVKQIEDIINNRDGIEGQGYEQKESGTKWVFHFTKDGKQEKLIIKRPDPRPFKEIKELKEESKN
jgi:hypothetical protein